MADLNTGEITGSHIFCTRLEVNGNIQTFGGVFKYNNYNGQTFDLIVQHEGQYWRRLRFRGGILTEVNESW